MSRDRIHRLIFLFSLLLFVTGIPFCRPLMSFGLILLSANWLAEGNFGWKWQQMRNNRILWVCLLLYAVPLAGLLYTRNLPYALTDLTIKLPLLLLPLFFATTRPLNKKELEILLKIYLFAVCCSALIGWINLMNHPEITDKREVAMHISYIRFELNLCFGFFVALYFLVMETGGRRRKPAMFCLLLAMLWLSGMTFHIGGLTAIFLGFVCLLFLAFKASRRLPNPALRTGVPMLIAAGTLALLLIAANSMHKYAHVPQENRTQERLTANGRPYATPLEQYGIEHGQYVFANLCEEELSAAWNQRSSLPYDGMSNDRNHCIRSTLIRYLNSKGLRKDSAGMAELDDKDIEAIENGIADAKYTSSGVKARYYETLRDLSLYLQGLEVSGSIPRRFEMWRISWITFTRSPLIGTGTGDVKDELEMDLHKQESPVLGVLVRSHNQYFSFGIAFGVVGLAVILFSLLYPPFASGRFRNTLYQLFLIIFLLSMLADDPMERQDGVTLFAFFNSLFLFLLPNDNEA